MRVVAALGLVACLASTAFAEEVPRDCDPDAAPDPGGPTLICPSTDGRASGTCSSTDARAACGCPNGDVLVRDPAGEVWRVRKVPDSAARAIWVSGLMLMVAGHIVGSAYAFALAGDH